MTLQQEAIELIKDLPDDKVREVISLIRRMKTSRDDSALENLSEADKESIIMALNG